MYKNNYDLICWFDKQYFSYQ